MKLNKKEVSQNLRLFGYKQFGSMKKFAEALEMNPSTLYSGYLNGRSIPGPVLLVKLIDLGCNINWLLTNRETMHSIRTVPLKSELSASTQPHLMATSSFMQQKKSG